MKKVVNFSPLPLNSAGKWFRGCAILLACCANGISLVQELTVFSKLKITILTCNSGIFGIHVVYRLGWARFQLG